MTNETRALVARPHSGLPTSAEFETIQRLAKAFDASGLFPNVQNLAQHITVVQLGRELGIPPAAALRSFAFISGKPTASAEMLAALIYRDHGDAALKVTETTNERCTVEYRRRGWDSPGRVTFTVEDAKEAGLLDGKNAGTWKRYRRAMLRSRAISEAARTAFQDSILGMYTTEELADGGVMVTESGEVVLETATPTPPARPADDDEPDEGAVSGEVIDPNEPPPPPTPPQRQRQAAPRPGPAQALSDGEVEALAPSQSEGSRLLDLRNQFRDELEAVPAAQAILRRQNKTVEDATPTVAIAVASLEWLRRKAAEPRTEAVTA